MTVEAKPVVLPEVTDLVATNVDEGVELTWTVPETDLKPLTAYLNNLKKGAVVTKNQYATHFIDDFALCKDNRLVISTHADDGTKKFSMITVTLEDGKYVHEGTTFFEEQGAQKALTLAQGLEWKGRDGIDDYC